MGSRRGWTEEEIAYLEEKWGSISIKGIAKNTNRTVGAVKLKANRLGLRDPRTHFDGITAHQLKNVLGVSNLTMKIWMEKYGFPATKKLFAVKSKVYVVKYDKFWKWAEEHKHLIDFSRVEKNILGEEPEWVDIKRGVDKIDRHRRHCFWTEEEDNILKGMVNAYCYTYPEIARALGRTEGGVKERLSALNIKARPLPLDGSEKYTAEEEEKLVELYNKGYSAEVIADIVGKSAMGVSSKLVRMGYRFREESPGKQVKAVNI